MSLRIAHPTKPKLVWKVYRQDVTATNKLELTSAYQMQRVIFKPNEVLKSSRRTKRLLKSEIDSMTVEAGLHVYTIYDEAASAAKYLSSGGYERGVLAAFYADPARLVAAGHFGTAQSEVYTQLTMYTIQAYYHDQRIIYPN